MKTYQKIIIAVGVCLIGFAAFQWYRHKSSPTHKTKEPIPVEASIAKSGEIARKVTTVGSLSAIQQVTIRAEIAGKIEKIYFVEGANVKKGDPLYKIEDSLYHAKVRELEAQVAFNKGEYKRNTTLLEKNFGTLQKRDESLAQLQMNQARLEEAKISLNKTVIRAPFDGTMGLSKVSEGAFVNENVELVTIVNLDPINVDFTIPESFLGKIKVGDKVDVTVEASDILPMEATIKAISPEIDISTRTITIRATMSNSNSLYRPGEFARVVAEAGKIDNAVLIPESAIEKRGDEEYVMAVTEDKVAVEKVISTGMRDDNNVEVTDGIKAGEYVITAGQFKVRDGDEVKIVNDPSKQ